MAEVAAVLESTTMILAAVIMLKVTMDMENPLRKEMGRKPLRGAVDMVVLVVPSVGVVVMATSAMERLGKIAPVGHTSVVGELAEGVSSSVKVLVVEIGEIQEKNLLRNAGTAVETEKEVVEKAAAVDANKETPAEAEETTPDEHEKTLEEKRKVLQSLTASDERKVDLNEFESMQQLANKKANNDVFIKLGSDTDKRKDALEKEGKAKKAVSMNEFPKPRGGRGRGCCRDGGSRGRYSGYQSEGALFPSLGGGK